MKSFITLLFVNFSVLYMSFAQGEKNYPLKSELIIIKEGYYPYFGMELYGVASPEYMFRWGKVYNVALKIQNTSGKTAYLWAMTCSWEANLIFSNDYIIAIGRACASNFPSERVIKPGATEVFKTTLALVPDPGYTYNHLIGKKEIAVTKLGFVVVNDVFRKGAYWMMAADLYQYAQDKSRQKAILWSNPLNFN